MSLSAFKILIVSEEPRFESWTDLLEDNETEVLPIRYQEMVVALNVAVPYDLVIVDLDETARQLTLCHKLRSVFEGAILVFTGETDPYLHLRIYGAGADKCVVRPKSPRLVRAMVAPWRRRLHKST